MTPEALLLKGTAMAILVAILVSGLLMSLIALAGGLSLLMNKRTQERLLLPLVALAAGTLVGGAFFHMLPAAVEKEGPELGVWLWLVAGFAAFFALEQFLHWHHCHVPACEHGMKPIGPLILIADGLHNFFGGLAVAGAFLIDMRLGWSAFLAAAAHEIPQELGDFGILVHGGLSRRRALLLNFLSALSFPVGGLIAWTASKSYEVTFLLPFAAGNFLYIAAADLVPEVKRETQAARAVLHFLCFAVGLALLLAVRIVAADGS